MMRGDYEFTTQRQLRRAFWQAHPGLSRKTVWDYDGIGRMHLTDTRVAFVDWIDRLEKDGRISSALAQRVTLIVYGQRRKTR